MSENLHENNDSMRADNQVPNPTTSNSDAAGINNTNTNGNNSNTNENNPTANNAASSEHLNLKVKAQDGMEVYFKVKKKNYQIEKINGCLLCPCCQRTW